MGVQHGTVSRTSVCVYVGGWVHLIGAGPRALSVDEARREGCKAVQLPGRMGFETTLHVLLPAPIGHHQTRPAAKGPGLPKAIVLCMLLRP